MLPKPLQLIPSQRNQSPVHRTVITTNPNLITIDYYYYCYNLLVFEHLGNIARLQQLSGNCQIIHATYLGEIPNQVTATVIPFCQNIEEERFDIVVKRLVVEEQLCQKAQILAVDLTLVAIDFKDRKVV